jgi:hypothetical protein
MRGFSSVGSAAESSTPPWAWSLTFAHPLGAWKEKPPALSTGPLAGRTPGDRVDELGEPGEVGEAACVPAAVVLLEEPQADTESAARAASPASGARAAPRCAAMR